MSTRLIFCLTSFVLCLLFAAAGGQVPLQKTPFWQSAENNMTTTGMVWRDCNKDGYIDVFFSNGNDITMSPNTIYISNNGTLPEMASWFSANNEYSGHCAVGDINDDGWPDFAVANFLGQSGFSNANRSNLYLNSAGSINTSPDWYTSDSIYTFSCALGDADGDGDLDLAFSTGESYGDVDITDRIYYNIDGVLQGLPGWQSAAATEAMDVTWGDVDSDGDLDLAFCYDDRPPAVHYSDNGSIETTPSWQAAQNESANTIVFGDVNGDGWLDLVVAFNYQLSGSGNFRVYFNDGSGNLNTQYGWQSATGGYGSALALYDYDNDGNLDLAAGRWWDKPRIYRNTGTTFTTSPVWQADVSTVVEELAWADVDGDGLQSLADTIYDVAGKKVFYTEKLPLYSIDSIMVDGVWLDYADYCFDLFSGWVSLGQEPIDSLIIYYKYSYRNDLAVANWDTYNMVFGYISVGLALEDDNFSDILGNNNGVPEAGEAIQLVVDISNSGSEIAQDVTINLTIDDATISIIDGTAILGNIDPYTSVSNNADPLEFQIPIDYIARIDSFFLEISWDSRADVDTFVIEKAMGKPSVLLVDEDSNINNRSYFSDCFDNSRIPHDIRDVSGMGVPSLSDVADYPLVFWYTGDYRVDPLNTASMSTMKQYLDNDGNLFLTGQGIAAQLSSADTDLLNLYLKSAYQSTLMVPVLQGVDGAQVVDSGIQIALVGTGSASNQESPDFLQPVNGGVAELLYLSQTDYGAVSFSGSYKSLLFSFGFEAITSGDSRWRDRDSIFTDILEFFNFQMPGGYPMVVSTNVSPGDPFHLTEHSPDIAWSYFDPDSSPQQKYQIQVGDDDDWAVAEMWDYGPISGSETQVAYCGLELMDGETYIYRVRVSDGSLWSNWYQDGFRMNSLPTQSTDLVPDNMQCIDNALPALSHTNVDDAEYDVLVYAYRVYDDPELTNLVAQKDNHPENSESTTSWQVDVPLADNSICYWRVRANDGFEDGPWSNTASFWVNSVNQAPSPFGLLSPDSGEFVLDSRPTFTWETSSDPDPCDSISYSLSYALDSILSNPVTISDLMDTSYIPAAPLESNTYYWKVMASDLLGEETNCYSVYEFTIGARGDANGDGVINVGDAVFLINYVFRGGPAPNPIYMGDANCDENVDVGDAVYLINYIFREGSPPGCFKN